LNSATEDDVDMNSRTAPAVGCHAQRSGLTPAWPRAIPVILKVLLAAATLFLLTSVGGAAAYASPITLPVLFLVARSSRQTAEGLLWAVLAAGSALETGWVLTYLAMGDSAVDLAAADPGRDSSWNHRLRRACLPPQYRVRN
jgi:hypothetical protein